MSRMIVRPDGRSAEDNIANRNTECVPTRQALARSAHNARLYMCELGHTARTLHA